LEMQKKSIFSDFYRPPNKLALMGHPPVISEGIKGHPWLNRFSCRHF
jgi:hypothetical protein